MSQLITASVHHDVEPSENYNEVCYFCDTFYSTQQYKVVVTTCDEGVREFQLCPTCKTLAQHELIKLVVAV